MEAIKNYFKAWNFSRIIRLAIGISLAIGYFAAGEFIYLFGGIVFVTQALLNLSCPGGACAPTVKPDEKKQIMTFEKYKPNKQRTNV